MAPTARSTAPTATVGASKAKAPNGKNGSDSKAVKTSRNRFRQANPCNARDYV